MKSQEARKQYVAFLRGINVGGHHKVPMAELRKELAQLGFENIITILNSGNIIFDAEVDTLKEIEKNISEHLENYFSFPIPTIVRTSETIYELFQSDPFKVVELTKDIRFYISLLKEDTNPDLKLPWTSSDKSYRIIAKKDKNILSILDISLSKTTKAMEVLEKSYGKEITTRNWNTIKRIENKIK